MALRDLIDKVRGMVSHNEQDVDIDDGQTKDRHLRSLRREMKFYQEQEEKKYLIKRLAEIKKQKLRENMFGVGHHEREKTILGKMPNYRSKVNILKERRFL